MSQLTKAFVVNREGFAGPGACGLVRNSEP